MEPAQATVLPIVDELPELPAGGEGREWRSNLGSIWPGV